MSRISIFQKRHAVASRTILLPTYAFTALATPNLRYINRYSTFNNDLDLTRSGLTLIDPETEIGGDLIVNNTADFICSPSNLHVDLSYEARNSNLRTIGRDTYVRIMLDPHGFLGYTSA